MSSQDVDEALEPLVGFARALREAGLVVGTDRVLAFCEGATHDTGEHLYWVGRATMVGRSDDLRTYDRVFRDYFLGIRAPEPPPRRVDQSRGSVVPFPLNGSMAQADRESDATPASAVESLRHKSFARCTDEELAELARLMSRLRLQAPMRLTRRRRPHRSGQPDLRRTLRQAFRTGGEPVELAWRRRRRRRRRIVFLLDHSGSMAAYSRALALFAHAALRTDARFEAFSFGTRLTRLTWSLLGKDPDEALKRTASEVADWDGGTRIGESVRALLARGDHARLVRGAVVVICSDGLDVGEPDLLREEMGRLRRLAHRVVWLNPLKEHPEYQPLARGMKAALPHIDVFASGHDLASLEAIAGAIARL